MRPVGGRYLSKTVYAPNNPRGKARARGELAKLVDESYEAAPPEHGTLADLADRWIKTRSADWSSRSGPEARARLDRHVLPTLGKMPVDTIRPLDIQALYNDLRETLKPATVGRIDATLAACLAFGVEMGLIERNPARPVRKPKVPRPKRVGLPAPATVRKAIEAAGTPAGAMLVRLAVSTGARRGELVRLRWSDVDLDAGVVRFAQSKTDTVKDVALGASTAASFRNYRDYVRNQAKVLGAPMPPWVFPSWKHPGTHIADLTASRTWGRIRKQVPELDGIRLHDLRHTMVTTLIGEHDARTVADRAGHSNPAMTLSVYAHGVDERDRAAAEAMDSWLDG